MTASSVWRWVSHTNWVTAVTGREDQRVGDPVAAGGRVEHQLHAPEVDLALVTRFAVGHPHRGALAQGAPARLGHVALDRPQRDTHALALEQLVHLHRGEIVGHPRSDALVMATQKLDRPATPRRSSRRRR
ncbi:MAG: hypothetical protein E6G27_18365 [Actinobacteria bacterium]|nr:MAG: hypothetical protein E6G27_18365 [Actinomycetota bacterium]